MILVVMFGSNRFSFAFAAALLLLLLPIQAPAQDLFQGQTVYFDNSDADGSLSGEKNVIPEFSFAVRAGEAAQSYPYQTIINNGPAANRVDLVFLGDGYTAAELPAYRAQVVSLADALFSESPLSYYRSYFNVHRLDISSVESGVDHDPTYGIYRQTPLGMGFWCNESESNLCVNVSDALAAAAQAPQTDTIVALANATKSGGSAYPYADLALISAAQLNAGQNLMHQFGHSFANLADEYDTGSWPDYTGSEPAEPNVSALTAQEMTFQKMKWFSWLNYNSGSAYGGTINTYEGAMGHLYRIYRPTVNSKMRTLGQPFNLPSVESFIIEIYHHVEPIDSATPATQTFTGRDTLSVTPLQPTDHDLSIQWYVNGTAVAGATGRTFRGDNYPYPDGTYEVAVEVVDKTPLVRDEEARKTWMTARRSWSVKLDQNLPVISTQPADQSVYPHQYAYFSVQATGAGTLKYQWYRGDTPLSGETYTSYSLLNVTRADEGAEFWVKVTNTAGSTSSRRAKLTVLNHAPTIGSFVNVQTVRNATRLQPVNANDADGDALTITAQASPADGLPANVVTVNGSQILIATGPTYLGTFTVNVTASDGIQSTSGSFTVTVLNRSPVLAQVADQRMHWKKDSLDVPLTVSDPDNDPLTVSGALYPGQTAPVVFSAGGNTLTINPSDGYLGNFLVMASATDSYTSVAATFRVTVYNTAPALSAIPNQTMHYRKDTLTVPLTAVDADGDPIAFSATVTPPSAAQAAISGSSVVLDPSADYFGNFTVTVTAADEKSSTSKSFNVSIYNTAPELSAIPNQTMHYRKDTLSVPLTAVDQDGDTVVLSATVSPSGSAQAAISGSSVVLDPAQDYLGNFTVTVTAADGKSSTSKSFNVSVYNTAPVLAAVSNQTLHWRSSSGVVVLSGSDADEDTLTYTASLAPGQTAPVALTLNGASLTINPEDEFLGSFQVVASVSDGKAAASRTFTVTVNNHAPQLSAIANQDVKTTETGRTIPLSASDPDGDPLTFSVTAAANNIAYTLDQVHDFRRASDSWNYNLAGLNEKYIQGTKHQAGKEFWYALLPDGKLYEWKGTLAQSILLATLPPAFYQQPDMLFDVPAPSSNVPLGLAVSGTNLVIPQLSTPGPFLVTVEVSDGLDKAAASFSLTVYGHRAVLSRLANPTLRWTEDKTELSPVLANPDTSEPAAAHSFSGRYYYPSTAYEFDQKHDFRWLPGYTNPATYPFNLEGRNEKYIQGVKEGTQISSWYALLPYGAVYEYSQSIDASKLVGVLPPVYYDDPTLLFDVPPPATYPPVQFSTIEGKVVVDPTAGYSGRLLAVVDASDEILPDSQVIIVNVANHDPVLAAIGARSVGKNYNSITFTLNATDADADPLSFNLFAGSYARRAYELDQLYNFELTKASFQYNLYGWGERWVQGTYQGQASDFAILPNGRIFKWNGSFPESEFVGRVSAGYHASPGTLFNVSSPGVVNATVTLNGKTATITVPSGVLTSVSITADVNDGCGYDDELFSFSVVDQAPSLSFIPDQIMHWREDTRAVTLSGSDPDGDPLTFSAALYRQDQAYALDQTHDFFLAGASFGYNLEGREEKYFQGTKRQNGMVYNYVLVPVKDAAKTRVLRADLYEYLGGTIAGSTKLATVPAVYYTDPTLLFDVARPADVLAPAVLTVQGSTLTIDPLSSFMGSFIVDARVTDGRTTTAQPFIVKVKNQAPVLSAVNDQELTWKETTEPIRLSAADPDGDPIEYRAYLGAYEDYAYELDQLYHFQPYSQSAAYAGNPSGWGERLVRGTAGGSAAIFAVFANGELYRWAGSLASSTFVGRLSSAYYEAPQLLFNVPPGGTAPDLTVSIEGDDLVIEPARDWTGRVVLRVEVTDTRDYDDQVVNFSIVNHAPVLGALADQTRHWRDESLTVDLAATDADGDELTFSASLSPADAGEAQVTLTGNRLVVVPASGLLGAFSVTVSVTDGALSDSRTFNVQVRDFAPVLTPIGSQEMKWRETSKVVPVTAVDTDDDPLTWTVALAPEAKNSGTVRMSGGQVLFERNPAFTDGSVSIEVEVSDGLLSSRQTFILAVVPSTPEIAPIADQTMNWREHTRTVPVSVTDAHNDPITLSAQVSPADPNGSVSVNGTSLQINVAEGYVGNFVVVVSASDGNTSSSASFRVFVKNTAPVIQPIANQTMSWRARTKTVAVSASDAEQDPLTLSAQISPAVEGVGVTLSGTTLQISTPDKYVGTFNVHVTASDGNASSTRAFSVTSINAVPVLGAIANQTMSWRQSTKTVPLSASDADGDQITLSAQILTSATGASVSVGGTNLQIATADKYVGSFSVQVTASDGIASATKTFTVTSTNAAPTMGAIANQTMGWHQLSRTIPVSVSDADGDQVTLTAQSSNTTASVSVSGTSLRIDVPDKFLGSFTVTATASDGALSASRAFNVTVKNNAPVIQGISNQLISWRTTSRTVALSATDADNDPLTFSAQLPAGAESYASVSVSGTSLTITQNQAPVSRFTVTVSVTDGQVSSQTSFDVILTNAAPVLTGIGDRILHWTAESLAIPLAATDADGDPVSFTAAMIQGDAQAAALSVAGSTLTVRVLKHEPLSFQVRVVASDGKASSSPSEFRISLTNNAPVLQPVPNQTAQKGVPSIQVTLSAADADDDPLVFSAEGMPLTYLIYNLDQLHNFELRYGNYYYNYNGNSEKYVQGTKNQAEGLYWYVIFPNGEFYEWSGRLSTSTYLAKLPVQYYENPALLFDVQAPAPNTAPAQVSVAGNVLTVQPEPEYAGEFFVKIGVTDGIDSDYETFSITINQTGGDSYSCSGGSKKITICHVPPGNPANKHTITVSCNSLDAHLAHGDTIGPCAGDSGCGMHVHKYQGEYSGNEANISFTAEGRIGDSATNPGSSTHEVSISRSANGPFTSANKANYIWEAERLVPFELVYDKVSGKVTFTVDGVAVSYKPTMSAPLTDLLVRAYASEAGTAVSLTNLVLDGQAVIADVAASDEQGATNVLAITRGGLGDGFVLQGKAVLTFIGAGEQTACETPSNSEVAFQISGANVSGHSADRNDCGNPGEFLCPGKVALQSPNYTLWNGFLRMVNILELVNPGDQEMSVKVSLYSITGELVHQQIFAIRAENEFDVILNQFPGFIENSYGVIKLEFEGPLDGRMMYYRDDSEGQGYDFVFGFPLAEPSSGRTAVSFNTFQPSFKPDEAANVVANWLTLVNLDSTTQNFVVDTYNQVGTLLLRRDIEIPPFGRADIDGGHDLAGPSVVGEHIIMPRNSQIKYIAQLTRFGGNAAAGFMPSAYRFAFPLVAREGASEPVFAPLSRQFDQFNWLEVVNILDEEVRASINLYRANGELVESMDAVLPPHGQYHFDAASYLNIGETGYAMVMPAKERSLIAQSMVYYRNPANGSITALYGSQARTGTNCTLSGSYNLFLNMENWLTVANTADTTVQATIKISSDAVYTERTFEVPARGSLNLPLHDAQLFNLPPNSYGLVAVTGGDGVSLLFGELLRARFLPGTVADFAVPTTVH